jgi:small-conductance mechanosensitive channel
MNDLTSLAPRILPYLPTVVVLVLTVVGWRLARVLLDDRNGPATGRAFRVQIVQLVILILATVVVLVVLPVDPDLRGQLLGLFGIVLSAAIALASTTFVGNVMAGMMLKAVRNFRTGDFVQVQEQFGRVTGRNLLSTEIQTEDRDLVTLPNLYLVTNPVRVVRSSGTLVSAEVSLGYDVAAERVERLLLAAAENAGLTDPFVLVMNLGDFAITYRVGGLLGEVKHLLTARSRLRRSMLQSLHGDGVEIVSPSFMNQRALDPAVPVIARPEPAATRATPDDEPLLEDVAFDKAEDAEDLEQLTAAHGRVREAIAKLAEADDSLAPDERQRRQTTLTRRLARIEAAMTRHRGADSTPD